MDWITFAFGVVVGGFISGVAVWRIMLQATDIVLSRVIERRGFHFKGDHYSVRRSRP